MFNYESGEELMRYNNYKLENPKSKRSLKILLTYFGIFFIGGTVISLLMLFIYGGLTDQSVKELYDASGVLKDSANLFVSSWTNFLTYIVGTIIICLLGYRYLIADLKLMRHNFFSYVFLGLAINLLASIVSNIITETLKIQGDSSNQASIRALLLSPYWPLMVIVTILLAPIVEELVFRKALFSLSELKQNRPIWLTILLSGFLFASIHVIMPVISTLLAGEGLSAVLIEFLYIIPYLTMGVALSYIYYRSNKNLWVVITIHAINNIIATLLIIFLPNL